MKNLNGQLSIIKKNNVRDLFVKVDFLLSYLKKQLEGKCTQKINIVLRYN